MSVTLNSIKNYKADITVLAISEEVPKEEPALAPEEEGDLSGGEEVAPLSEETKNLNWVWIVLVLIALALIIYSIITGKKKGKRKK